MKRNRDFSFQLFKNASGGYLFPTKVFKKISKFFSANFNCNKTDAYILKLKHSFLLEWLESEYINKDKSMSARNLKKS